MTKIKKSILILIFVFFSLVTAVIATMLVMVQPVFAEAYDPTPDTYENFLSYSGSDNFYKADIGYDKLISSIELPYAQVKLIRTKLQDGYWDKISVSSVRITLTTPITKTEYVKQINKSDEEIILFDRSHMYEEGTYTVKASGSISAGASTNQRSSFTFEVDLTAPTGTLSGVANHGFTSGNVRFTWTEEGATATLDGNSYSKNAVVSSEGSHKIELKDIAGNISTYNFTIDRTPPVGAFDGVVDGGGTNSDVTFSWQDDYATATLNGENYTKGAVIHDEGYYTLVLTDRANNFTKYSFLIDRTAPEVSGYKEYTNKRINLSATDKYSKVSHWQYRRVGGAIYSRNGATMTMFKDYDESLNGIWEMRAVDAIGNETEWFTTKYLYRETFGNSEVAYNTYFIPAYYNVTLSQKNYIDYSGTYEFSDYAAALSFAIQKEWACRVIELNGGKEWNYVTPNNENARQIYVDRTELDSVINKYARANISERKIIGQNGATLNNPTDKNGVTRADALTRQLTTFPDILSDYSDCIYMLVPANHIFTMPQSIVDGNKATLKVQFVSDGISVRLGNSKTLSYGEKLSTVAEEQGWYLVEESDVCGNVEKYLVYIDCQQPQIHAEVTFGSGVTEIINFDETYISENTEAMRYLSFDIKTLSDNIDDYVMLTIDGRGLSSVQYVCGDELPVLTYENGFYGTYTINVYDRSLNVLEFVVYVAGAAPSLTYTSLTNETSCTFTIQVNDSKNEIKDVRIYKVFYDGTRERLEEDSSGTTISAENLVYKMTVGGKYVFEFSDLYGRNVSTNPIFYMKGLPIATLRGVKDGGITKNDVRISFEATCTLELTVLNNGEWVPTDLYSISEGINQNTASITAGRDTTAIYKVLLYVSDDRNLFTEYTFEIDAIPPAAVILTESGSVVEPDSVTIQSFYLTWEEAGYSAWYRRSGSVSDDTYIKNTTIKTAGTYIFTVLDAVRNELTFTVTLDNAVDYTLDGTSNALFEDGCFITRGNFVFTVLEPWSVFEVDASNGIAVSNGQKLDTDGTYTIRVKDVYGNSLTIKLIVDKLPPEPVIMTESGRTISSGARINEAFSVSCAEDDVNIIYSSGGANVAYNGSLLSAAGNYTFTLTDRVGNSSEVKIFIDKALAFNVNGTYVLDSEGNYISRNWLSISLSEEMSEFYILAGDGTEYGAENRVSAEGKYEVYLQDKSGNERTLVFVIDKTPPSIELIGVENGVAMDGAATVKFIDYTEAYYRRNGGDKIAVVNGAVLINEGSYVVTALDLVGNVATATFAIDKSVDVTPSVEFVNGQILNRSVSFSFGEEVTALLYSSGKETIYTRGEISDIGDYTLVITDNYHNSKTFEWSIVSRKAREYVLPIGDYNVGIVRDGQIYSADIQDDKLHISEAGKYELEFRYGSESWMLELEVDNVAPTVEIKNTGKTVEIFNPSKDGVTYALYRDGNLVTFNFNSATELKQKGHYRLVCTDDVGNTTEYVFELNYMSATTIVLIAVIVTLVIAVIVAIVIIRLRRRKY